MKKRLIAIGTAVLIVVMALLIVKALPAKNKKKQPNTETKAALVKVIQPKVGNVAYNVTSTGKITAAERLVIFAQVEGQLLESAKTFREGKKYSKGDIMLAIDAEEYRMTLLSQKSNFITLITSILPDLKADYPIAYKSWRAYVLELDINKKLPAMPKANDDQEKFYLSGKGVYANYFTIQSSEERFYKYTIRAPFNGIVTASQAEAGMAVRSGTELGAFINPSLYDLEVTLPLAAMKEIKIGTETKLSSSEMSGEWNGKVIRIGGDIDELSQSVKVFIRTSGQELKEGMYLTAHIGLAPFENAMSIPRKMIDDNNQVFIVEDGKLIHRTVKVLMRQGDIAIIEGLDNDAAVLSTVVKNAYDGMPVSISN
ncbi:efflux RND transporter periplasmic adaptor subunit [Labilibacter marinus]|uniref:efflux RND transporter periplasmic adaptor subunit n=1 Tax=Labilibacter marinus TaxID=1477105 RepID=UPI00082A1193|nr:efflux RND transporter periplasmic adaptor subunit [Labilibacter marinus]